MTAAQQRTPRPPTMAIAVANEVLVSRNCRRIQEIITFPFLGRLNLIGVTPREADSTDEMRQRGVITTERS